MEPLNNMFSSSFFSDSFVRIIKNKVAHLGIVVQRIFGVFGFRCLNFHEDYKNVWLEWVGNKGRHLFGLVPHLQCHIYSDQILSWDLF